MKKIIGTSETPRISIVRSNKYLSAQIIDDSKKKTIIGISEKTLKEAKGSKTENAKALGLRLAELAKAKKISKAVFDRGNYAYHGRIKAFVEAVREGGIKI